MNTQMRVMKRLLRIHGGGEIRREEILGEVLRVTVIAIDFITDPLFAHQESHRIAVACEKVGHGSTKGATAADGDAGLGGDGGGTADAG